MADFKLVSDFEPMGDQPRAIEQLVEGVRRGDEHRVNIITSEQFTEVFVGSTPGLLVVLVHTILSGLEHVGFDVAYGHNPSVVLFEEVAHNAVALRADTDATNRDSLTGCRISGTAQRRR